MIYVTSFSVINKKRTYRIVKVSVDEVKAILNSHRWESYFSDEVSRDDAIKEVGRPFEVRKLPLMKAGDSLLYWFIATGVWLKIDILS